MSRRIGKLEEKKDEAFNKFSKYIIWDTPRRLREDAPSEAVEAFHEYFRLAEEQDREDEKWPGEII